MSPERALSIESIQEEARRMRAVLASFATSRLSPATLLPERVLLMSEMRLSYGTERVRDNNDTSDRFDWKARAARADEAAALSQLIES
jgi:hypothetical protein